MMRSHMDNVLSHDSRNSLRDSLKQDWAKKFSRVILFLGIAIMLCIADRAPMHLNFHYKDVQIEQEFLSYFDGIVHGTAPGPYVYRILVPFFILNVQKIFSFADVLTIDFLLKIVLLYICQSYFFRYLRLFLGGVQSLAGVFLFDVYISLSLAYVQGPSFIETEDILNTLVFVAALDAIYRNRFMLLCGILFIGLLNRETVLLILPALVLADRSAKRGYMRSGLITAAMIMGYIGIRLFVGTKEFDWVTIGGMVLNIPYLSEKNALRAVTGNLHMIALLGPLITISAYNFKNHISFLKLAASIVPLFIVVHYVFGTIIETRLWMPLFVILIPLAIGNLQKFLETLPPASEKLQT